MFNNRLTLSTGISLLVHLFVLFSLNLLLQLHTKTPVAVRVEALEVRFSPPLPPRAQPKPDRHLLTRDINTQFSVTQPDTKKTPDNIPKPPAHVVESPAPPTQGITLPGAITLPWQLPGRSSSSLFHPPPSQQNAAQIYYQRAMAAQARQQSEQQAQLMMQQLQQLLARLLDADPVVTGTCVLAESDGAVNNSLKCDSSALYEALLKDEETVAGMLLVLRGMGRVFNGFSAEIHAGKLSITLINEVWGTRKKSSTQDPNKTQ